jgi:poly(3-hydroxybutyrate) depolymerase
MRSLIVFIALISAISTAVVRSEEPAPGKQVEQELKPSNDKAIPYLLYLPKEYASKEGKWPLMIFLHGRGESRGPLSVVKVWGPPRIVDRGQHLPYVIVSPQCPNEESWAQPHQQQQLKSLLDHILKQYKIDADRIYLTGLSMGVVLARGDGRPISLIDLLRWRRSAEAGMQRMPRS